MPEKRLRSETRGPYFVRAVRGKRANPPLGFTSSEAERRHSPQRHPLGDPRLVSRQDDLLVRHFQSNQLTNSLLTRLSIYRCLLGAVLSFFLLNPLSFSPEYRQDTQS